MKKLLAVLMAALMIITLAVTVFAEETENPDVGFSASASADYVTSNGLGTYNAGGSIDIVVSLSDVVVPETIMGVSVFMFKIVYEQDKVTPAVSGGVDIDGESFDYTSLLTNCPDGWECFGKVDSENGIFDLAIWDPTSINPIVDANAIEIVIPFTVKDNAKGNDLVFSFDGCEVVETNLEEKASLEIEAVLIEYALYPDEMIELPEDAIALEIGGFQDGKNVVYFANEDITVGEYISLYEQENNCDMSNYGIVIADSDTGRVDYFDFGNEAKADVVIPKGKYFVGVIADSDDFDKLADDVAIDAIVTIYNINPESVAKLTEAIALTDAGFTVMNPKPIIKSDVPAVCDFENAIIKVGASKLKINDFENMFENSVTVLDADGNEVKSGYVKTGMTIDYADGIKIIMIGDVYVDGKVDSYDYLYVRRYCFNTLDLDDLQFVSADCNSDGEINSLDYLLIKRIFFGTIDIAVLAK